MDTRINLKIGQNELEISGDEKFVEQKLQELLPKIEMVAIECKPLLVDSALVDSGNKNMYIDSGVYSIGEDGVIRIHLPVPGNTKSEKTRNIALILAYAADHEVHISEVTAECKNQSCYDPKNQAVIFKKAKQDFIVVGNGAKKALRLTVLGRKHAESVLNGMVAGLQESK